MNWFTKEFVSNATEERKRELVFDYESCEHVKSNPSCLHTVVYENDSFGHEGYNYCKECYEKMKQEQQEELWTCNDCGNDFPRKEILLWTPYDFYPAQGDEETPVCIDCQGKTRHLDRVHRDKTNEELEFGSD